MMCLASKKGYIFVFTFFYINLLSCVTCQPSQLIAVGLFSSCGSEGHSSSKGNNEVDSIRTTESLIYQKLTKSMFERDCMTPKVIKHCDNITQRMYYEEYDVCHSHEMVHDISLQINLNSSYFADDDGDGVYRDKESGVYLIITYLDQHLQKIMASLAITIGSPVMVIFNPDVHLPHPLRSRALHYTAKTVHGKSTSALLDVFLYSGWESAGVFLIASGNKQTIFTEMYRHFLDGLERAGNICFYNVTVDTENQEEYQRIVDKVKLEDLDYPRIVFGEKKEQMEFIRKVEKDLSYDVELFWIVHDLMTIPEGKKTINLISIGRTQYIRIQRALKDYNDLVHPSLADIKPTIQNSSAFKSVYNSAKLMLYNLKDVTGAISKPYSMKRFSRLILLRSFRSHLASFLDVTLVCLTQSQEFMTLVYRGHRSDLYALSNVLISYTVDKCPQVACKPGMYTDFGPRNGTLDKMSSYGWTCRLCPIDHVKNFTGHGACTACLSLLVSNAKRTTCFDPYKIWFLNMDVLEIKLLLCLSAATIFLTLATIFVVVIHRKTPIALAMDLKISLFHLFMMVCISAMCMVCLFGKPDRIRCTLRPVSYVIHSITVSITLMRSQKIFEVFTSKVKLEKQGLIMVNLKQSGVVITNIIIATGLLVTSLNMQSADPICIMHSDILQRKLYCRVSFHISLQACFQIFLHVACFIPAFRCRNLPSVFNDAMTIVYLSFTAIVVYVVMFPIEYFQKELGAKTIVHWLFLLVNVLIHLLAYYGGKVYLMLFKPHKNTKEYFRRQTMEAAQQKVTKLQAKRSASLGKDAI